MTTFKQLTDYFQQIGATEVSHTSKTYLAHAIGVYRDLQSWGCDEELARVGLFHSIYGTELFQGFTLPLDRRHEVRALIGERAERIAWLNCAIDRAHFDREIQKDSGPYRLRERWTGELVDVSEDDMRDLCVVHLCDWVEQIERSGRWDYRRDAYRTIASRLGGIAKARYEETFAKAPAVHSFNG